MGKSTFLLISQVKNTDDNRTLKTHIYGKSIDYILFLCDYICQ